jgi:hypothetical protein
MLPLFPLLFLAATAAPAGLVGRFMTPRSLPREFLTFSLIVIITSVVAVAPETLSVLRLWIAAPKNLSVVADLAIYQAQSVAAATLFAGIGWVIGTGVQCIFED